MGAKVGESEGEGSSEEANARGLVEWGRVPIKAVSTSSLLSPMASKICAPCWYAESSEMPTSERISSPPTSSALRTCGAAGARSVAIELGVKMKIRVQVQVWL